MHRWYFSYFPSLELYWKVHCWYFTISKTRSGSLYHNDITFCMSFCIVPCHPFLYQLPEPFGLLYVPQNKMSPLQPIVLWLLFSTYLKYLTRQGFPNVPQNFWQEHYHFHGDRYSNTPFLKWGQCWEPLVILTPFHPSEMLESPVGTLRRQPSSITPASWLVRLQC